MKKNNNPKEKIKLYAKKIGIKGIGFIKAEPIKELIDIYGPKESSFNYDFQKGSTNQKINPKEFFSDGKTIVAVFLSYPKINAKIEKLSDKEVYFSASSWGIDYHVVMKEKLEKLAHYIGKYVPDLKYKIAVDNTPLCDRTIAYKAGLGFFGKNKLLINDKYGSYIFLASLFINIDIEPDGPLKKQCYGCNKCIRACPTKALSNNGFLDSKKCLSYITQKKGILTEAEKTKINKCIYGCDICISVCPHNNSINNYNQEFKYTGVEIIDIEKYSPLTNKNFKQKYGHLAGSWRGATVINRNIKIYKDRFK